MEDKNKWDAYVNDITFWGFLHDTYGYMLYDVGKEVDMDLNYFYPKIKELNDWSTFLNNQDYRLTKDVLKQEGKENIWEIVEDWWITLFKALYFY